MAHSHLSVASGTRMQLAMGTFVTVQAAGTNELENEKAIAAALDVVAELERLLHPRRSDSDISAINSATLGIAVPIAETTWRLLQLTTELFDASMGIFDPCLPSCAANLESLSVAPTHAVVHERLDLDLGGIAKGFAADEALAALKRHNCTSGSVNIGGEVAAFGDAETILVRRRDGSLLPFALKDEAIAITDANAASRPLEHRGYYQRADRLVRVRDYAAIVAPSAAIADALTKCALYSSDAELSPILARFGARIL